MASRRGVASSVSDDDEDVRGRGGAPLERRPLGRSPAASSLRSTDEGSRRRPPPVLEGLLDSKVSIERQDRSEPRQKRNRRPMHVLDFLYIFFLFDVGSSTLYFSFFRKNSYL